MRKTKILAALALCAALTTGTAFARDHDRDKAGSGNHSSWRDRDHGRDHDRWRDHREHERRESWQRERRERERREARARDWRRHHAENSVFANNGQPRGWTQGRKTGWRNCDVPPGQAKPAGCAPSTWQHNQPNPRPVRDRDHDGDRR